MKKWWSQRKNETEAQYKARVEAHGAKVWSRAEYKARVQVRGAKVWARAARAKARLRVHEMPDPSECLTGTSLPRRAQVPARFARLQPVMPPQVQKAAAQADQLFHAERARMRVLPVPRPRKKPVSWLTSVPVQSRRHRTTGKPDGRRPNEDIGLGAAVHALADNHGISLDEAKREIAWGLVATTTVQAGKITFSAAMNRVRKALLAYYRCRILKALHEFYQ